MSKTDQAPQPKFRSDYRPPAYLVDRVQLDFDLVANRTIVKARIEFRRNPAGEGGPLVLDGEKLELLSLTIDGKALSGVDYKVDDDALTVPSVPAAFTLESEVAIDPAGNSELEGLYLSGGNFCTQCEPESFRRITFYPDRPDVLARYSVRMTADKAAYPVLLSNGNPGKSGDLPGGRHFAEWDDPWPKPCYLFALVAGNLGKLSDSFVTRSGRKVQLGIYAAHQDLDKLTHAMDSLKKSMRWDEENYNAEYDLDVFNIVAVSDFNAGAMENKGLNIFNTKYVLAKAETATDSDYDQIEAVVAHEYFHNWSGDRVTCRDWFQLSLKEGFTVFRDQQFSADMGSAATVRIDRVKDLRRRQFPEDAGPTAHPVRPDSYIEMNNFFTPTVYEKGSEVIRMLQNLAGPSAFRKGAELYFKRHDGQAVTCDDFVAAMAEASGLDLSQFKLWYSQAGTPELEVSSKWDQAAGKLTLKVKQSVPPTPGQSEKQPMHIPLAIGLVGPDGYDLPPTLEGEALSNQGTTRTLHLRKAEETFTFVGLKAKPVLSLLRGFSAPVKLKGERSADELAFLMAKDQDAFARWEAGQQLAVKVLLALVVDYRAGRSLTLDATFQGAMAALLDDRLADPALIAYAASLPSREYIADQMDVVDVEGIDAAYDFLRRSLAQRLSDRWQELYRRHKDDGAYRYAPDAVGKRLLRNLALSYLSAEGGAQAEALVLSHLDGASNMTDRLAALRLLDDLAEAPRAQALAAFAKDWRSEALVMDKWFAIQAVYRLPDILVRLDILLADPSFDYKNPNKVYALIASFGAGNFSGFHQASGAGYRFLADQILKIDKFNPQVAARLMVPLGRWRRQDGERQKKMRAELERVLAAPDLSKGVFELASKALAA